MTRMKSLAKGIWRFVSYLFWRNCIIGMSEGYGHGLVIDPNETGVAKT